MTDWSYDGIKKLIKENGGKVQDYIAMSRARDPFYIGTKGQHQYARWFADIWQKYDYNTGVHLRRVHYQIVSQETPTLTHEGDVYQNTDKFWSYLNTASRFARYLGYIDPSCFDDRRAGKPAENYQPQGNCIDVNIDDYSNIDIALPDMPSLPDYELFTHVDQPYQLEIWTEKSTMNDILLPLCSRYGVNLVSGVGEISLTHAELLVQRLKHNRKPCRIFYVSDFDPAGQSMPVAAARKIEYFIYRTGESLDIQLDPAVLTKQQCLDYKLPRTPIKEGETRAATFEARHGDGATELDALEALFPGELKNILEGHILEYYDSSLEDNMHHARSNIYEHLIEVEKDVYDKHREELARLNNEYESLKETVEQKANQIQTDISNLYETIKQDLRANRPQYDENSLPETKQADPNGKPLFCSERTYIAQIQAYKHFQSNGASH